jgi:hypothetical protein
LVLRETKRALVLILERQMVDFVEPGDVIASTIFCDDIRTENTGKQIYIGVYQSVLLVTAPFPIHLPLAMAVSLMQRNHIPNDNAFLRVFLPGDGDDKTSDECTFSIKLDPRTPDTPESLAVEEALTKHAPVDTSKTWKGGVIPMRLFLEIKEPGSIKLRLDIDGKRYPAGRLLVERAPENLVEPSAS